MDGAAGRCDSHIRRAKKENAGTFFYENTEHVMYEWLQTDRHGILTHIGETGNKYPLQN